MTLVAGKSTSEYWDGLLTEFQEQSPALRLWRAYMRAVYGRLLRDWLPNPPGSVLKTDLFEEAISEEGPLQDLGPHALGLDASFEVVQGARLNFGNRGIWPRLLVGDLRHIPLKAGALNGILSGSSLDHFADAAEIAVSLAELRRILSPGGTLIITFDNPHNPVVWLRNNLPFHWLNRLGLVPYYVGPTYTRAEGLRQLSALGFKVTQVTAVAHAPRIVAMALVRVAEARRWVWLLKATHGLMQAAEMLERLPTRYLTGYYLAFCAEVSGH